MDSKQDFLFRGSVDLVTMHHVMNIFADLGSAVAVAGSEIAELRVQIARKEKFFEDTIKDGFMKLFLALADWKTDCIVK